MTTKYDIGDEVFVKAIVHKISSDKTGKINYRLDISNCVNYIDFEENEITGAVRLEKKVKVETIDEIIKKLAESEDTILSYSQYHTLRKLQEESRDDI